MATRQSNKEGCARCLQRRETDGGDASMGCIMGVRLGTRLGTKDGTGYYEIGG